MGRYVFMKKKLLNITCFIIFPLSLFSQQQNDVEQAPLSSGNYATQSNDQNNPFVIHEVIQNKQQDGKTEQISPIAQQQKMSVASCKKSRPDFKKAGRKKKSNALCYSW